MSCIVSSKRPRSRTARAPWLGAHEREPDVPPTSSRDSSPGSDAERRPEIDVVGELVLNHHKPDAPRAPGARTPSGCTRRVSPCSHGSPSPAETRSARVSTGEPLRSRVRGPATAHGRRAASNWRTAWRPSPARNSLPAENARARSSSGMWRRWPSSRLRPSRRAGGSPTRTASCRRTARARARRGRPGSSPRGRAACPRRTGRAASGDSGLPRARSRRTSGA